jgi:CheY-like chemotaxis protein
VRELSTVLLVEDNPDDVELILHAFKRAAVTNPIQVVTDGEQAIGYLSGTGHYADRVVYPVPRLVLLDLKLPRRSGFEVIEAAKANSSFRRVPIVVLTSSNQNEDLRKAYDLGASGYLVKPGKRDALVEMMRSVDAYWLCHNEVAE